MKIDSLKLCVCLTCFLTSLAQLNAQTETTTNSLNPPQRAKSDASRLEEDLANRQRAELEQVQNQRDRALRQTVQLAEEQRQLAQIRDEEFLSLIHI